MILRRIKRAAGANGDRIFLKIACKTEEAKHVSQKTQGECTFQILHAENFESFGKVYEFVMLQKVQWDQWRDRKLDAD